LKKDTDRNTEQPIPIEIPTTTRDYSAIGCAIIDYVLCVSKKNNFTMNML